MAAVQSQSSRPYPNNQSRSSNPFVDPTTTTTTRNKQRAPPPPPKPARMPAVVTKPLSPHDDIKEAVRDTVTLRSPQGESPRTRMGRSQTAADPPNPRSTGGRRSHSQDSGNLAEKSKPSGKSRKKGSQHADVIDRLDFTGVGPMFHHDGPFDACAPSRNKHRNKAPMHVWGDGDPLSTPQYGDSAYPSAHAMKAFSNHYVDPPKKKVDAIAEAWGIHEPEPFEEFFAGGGRPDGDTPASSIFNGRESNNSNSTSRSAPARGRTKEEPARSRANARRSMVPPPQPIFVPDATEPLPGSPPASSPELDFKRSKSIMHRIRRMRDNPNVPVGGAYDQPPSPSSPNDNSRPTHRAHNSFLGRFGGGSRTNPPVQEEPFVLIEASNNKQLPATPALNTSPVAEDGPSNGYFDGQQTGAPSSSPGLGRKTSLMKKVGKVVRGSK